MSICENCILYGFCGGNCADTNENFYAEQMENEERDSRPEAPSDYYGD